jgi:ribosome-binding ATPase YchF (GTP1/OBG family)
MSEHLSSEQIADWMLGDRAAEAMQHVRACAECERRVEQLEETLGMFRGAVRETADSFDERQRVFEIPRRRMGVMWATLAAALVTLVAIPVYQVQERHQHQAAAAVVQQDAELMEQVNAELSEDVARPMKPLEKMVSWGPAAKSLGEKRAF